MAAVPFKVKAVYEYASGHEDDLPFSVGQIITVTDQDDVEWYGGEYVDAAGVKHEGIFPRNFVEKFEPTAPPRPVRFRKRDPESPVSAAAGPSALPPTAVETPEHQVIEDDHAQLTAEESHEMPITAPPVPAVEQYPPTEAPPIPVAVPPVAVPVLAPAPIESIDVAPVGPMSIDPPLQPRSPPPAQPRSPPPVSQKPASNSFRDRIAAFNKPAAPPVAPFKPSGLGTGSSGFIKKPFVAPPPSRHAYVPPPRDVPVTKIYRRDEDPEMKETQLDSVEHTEKARVVPDISSEAQDENQPKPTTLKERIALLQKQQAEAAQRHTDAAAKKEKPKRPPKKHAPGGDAQELPVADQPADMALSSARTDSTDVNRKPSMDESQSGRQSLNLGRKSIDYIEDDGNKSAMQGPHDTTEGQEDPVAIERDGGNERRQPVSREGTDPEGSISLGNEQEEDGEEEQEGGEEEEEEVDPEIKRKEELRARMAKMSGGMGMAGMFSPPGMMGFAGAPAKKAKPPVPAARRSSVISEGPSSPRLTVAPVPTLMALPGLGKQQKLPEEVSESGSKQESGEEKNISASIDDIIHLEPEIAPPAIPGGRPAPPPIPTESRPPPPPPPPVPAAGAAPHGHGSESDDENSENRTKPQATPNVETSQPNHTPPFMPVTSPALPTSPRFSHAREEMSPVSPGFSPSQRKRNNRPPPPIPGVPLPAPTQPRPPPPLPPITALSRPSTADDLTGISLKPIPLGNGEEVNEYEGAYETDIASSVPHQDVLGVHATEQSLDDSSLIPTEQPPAVPPSVISSIAPTAGPPPIPTQYSPTSRASVDIPRGDPPPIPAQFSPRSGASVDFPRAAPPPPPPPKSSLYTHNDEDYDPYNYNALEAAPGSSHDTTMLDGVEQYAPHEAPPPPPAAPSTERRMHPSTPTSSRAPPRKSVDIIKPAAVKRSLDIPRHSISMESAFMANELDLASHTQWWLSRHGLPPVFQGRKDIYTEFNELTSTEEGKTFVTKTVLVLFQDYSQTVITVRFNPQDPSQTALEQQHEPSPRSLRQDELEEAYESFGRRLAHSAASKKDAIVGDGTPHALVHELLRPLKEALLPVGTRAYGALVYANLANASTQLNDEIRPGDIISIRNAKFQGKHGPMHAKYTMEVGKPDHVAIVAEWDGTKKKVRAWEQGRENKKVKQESYKLEDLRSGEVKIWRVMPRTWVGWSPKD
ncbi:hypothetical protein GGS21DRAFT_527550 [Xylaria nigripes]|nr:hypothetical protein GGS21DRAFT_527550 [Xylaria nigripes]